MSRLMSVSYTEQAVLERRKTVTRRAGWWLDKRGRRLLVPGDTVTLCRKVMGRKKGEPLVRLVDVEAVAVTREPLAALLTSESLELGSGPSAWAIAEVEREGFPGMDPAEFVQRFFVDAQGITPSEPVTRIEWRYLEVHGAPPVGEGQMPCCRRPVFEAASWHRVTYDAGAVTCPGVLDQLQAVTR
jgi:hypothetical protein